MLKHAILICTAAAAGLLAVPASADVVDDNPAVVSRGSDAQVFARGADGTIYSGVHSSAGWTGWTTLGWPTASGPGATVYRGQLQLLARGLDEAMWLQAWSGSTSAPPQSLTGLITSAPAAVPLRGTDQLWVFARGGDNRLYYKVFDPKTGWSVWQSPGGNISSAPAAVSRDNGVIDLVARGGSGDIVKITWDRDHWIPWSSLGGRTSGAPAVTSQGTANLEVFITGTDGRVLRKTWKPGSWTDWTSVDSTAVTSGPAATSQGPGQVSVVARTGDTVSLNQLAGGRWSGWSSLGAVRTTPPPPVPPSPCTAATTADAGLRLSAAINRPGRSARRRARRATTVRYQHRVQVRGRLTTTAGQPVSGATLCVGTRRDTAGARLEPRASVVTDGAGRFVYPVPRGPSRRIRVAHRTAAGAVVASTVHLRVRAPVRLSASSERLRVGETMRLRGRLGVPKGGVLVELQVWSRERWRTLLGTTRTDKRGRFGTDYVFTTRTVGRQRYRFRALVPVQPGYPFARGVARPVSVEVRG